MSLCFVHTRTRQCLNKANCNQDGETSGGTPAPTISVSLSIANSRTEASNINICSLHHANKLWKTIAACAQQACKLASKCHKKNRKTIVRLKLQEDRGSASILSLKGCPSKQNTKTRRFVSHNSAYAQKPRYNCKITQDALARKCTETKCIKMQKPKKYNIVTTRNSMTTPVTEQKVINTQHDIWFGRNSHHWSGRNAFHSLSQWHYCGNGTFGSTRTLSANIE